MDCVHATSAYNPTVIVASVGRITGGSPILRAARADTGGSLSFTRSQRSVAACRWKGRALRMKDARKYIEELQSQYKKHRRSGLKELPTRVIFIDPLLKALGWDIRDLDEVEVEYGTIDGKSMDYALKINKKPVILLEAKALEGTTEE